MPKSVSFEMPSSVSIRFRRLQIAVNDSLVVSVRCNAEQSGLPISMTSSHVNSGLLMALVERSAMTWSSERPATYSIAKNGVPL